MPEYLAPGVYIEEIERGPRPIEGVPTSTAAFLGETERGPIRPRLVTSYTDYKRWFGDVWGNRDRYMPYAANGFFENGGRRLFVCRIVGENAATAERAFGDYAVRAVGAGAWGNRVWARIMPSTTQAVQPGSTTPTPVGFRLRAAYWASVPANFTAFDPFDNPRQLPRPQERQDFDDLVLDETSFDYYEKRLNGNSFLVELARGTGTDPTALPTMDAGLLENGADDTTALGSDDFQGDVAGARPERQGLSALELDRYRDVALVYAPYQEGAADQIAGNVITHCERSRFRFAVIDCARNVGDPSSLDPRTSLRDTQYAAFYYPWVQISDPQSGMLRLVPPGGYALGIYARTDAERGVFKAPANEVPRGVISLEYDITDRMQEDLNPKGVNAIRRFPGRGIRVWGARTLSANTLWKYISVRRLFIFIERSIYEGTQWVVFEPNNEQLWDRVTDTIRVFLRGQFRGGALMGRTEAEAFFITCDRRTMTQDDILNGRLICEIGIAPVRPAEFVIFRIFQHTAEAQR